MQETVAQCIVVRVAATNEKPKQNEQSEKDTPSCRICLMEMTENEIFSPCQCKGSNSYFHEECLLEWVKKSKKYKDSFRTYYYLCEICKGRIFLQTNIKYRCITSDEAKQELCEKYICCTLTTIIFLFCSFIVLGIIIYISSLAATKAQIVVYSIGLVITLITILITLLVYVCNYIIKSDIITTGIQKVQRNKQQRQQKSKTKIAPILLNPLQHRRSQQIRMAHNNQINQSSLDGIYLNSTFMPILQ